MHAFTLQLSLCFLGSITLSHFSCAVFGGGEGVCLFMILGENYFGLYILSFQEKKATEPLNSF